MVHYDVVLPDVSNDVHVLRLLRHDSIWRAGDHGLVLN